MLIFDDLFRFVNKVTYKNKYQVCIKPMKHKKQKNTNNIYYIGIHLNY
jgi:hypothetical protein